jgi:hypothetical protein
MEVGCVRMELNKYQIKFELTRLQKLKNDLIEAEITSKVKEISQQIFNQKQELSETELEQLLMGLAQELKLYLKDV